MGSLSSKHGVYLEAAGTSMLNEKPDRNAAGNQSAGARADRMTVRSPTIPTSTHSYIAALHNKCCSAGQRPGVTPLVVAHGGSLQIRRCSCSLWRFQISHFMGGDFRWPIFCLWFDIACDAAIAFSQLTQPLSLRASRQKGFASGAFRAFSINAPRVLLTNSPIVVDSTGRSSQNLTRPSLRAAAVFLS